MSILKNDNENEIKELIVKSAEYEVPAVLRDDDDEVTFGKSLVWAFILHPLVVVLILACSFILKLLGIDFSLFHKPPIVPKDIEFVLVEKEAPPIDKNTKNRADKNSRAGGKHDPKRAVTLPQQSAPKSEAKKPSAPAPAQKTAPQKAQPQQKKAAQPQKSQPKVQQSAPSKPVKQEPVQPKPTAPAPKPTAPKPAVTPSTSAPKPNPSSTFNIPMPSKSAIPVTQPTMAPVTSAPSSSGSTGGTSGSGKSSSPAPSFSPTTSSKGSSASGGNGSGNGGGGRFSNGTGNSRGNVGNPGPGNPNGAPGIDAIKEPDFGPYMKELQRRIKMNWEPPKGNESKRVVLLFSIARDGRLLNVKVQKSSGLQAADDAAINAVKLTAPFRPLPPEFKGEKVDIQFTFDYTVFGVNNY